MSVNLKRSVAVLIVAAAAVFTWTRVVRSESTRAARAYEQVVRAYVEGNLEGAARDSADHVRRWQNSPNSPWLWKFRLLRAEVLTTQARFGDAEALLSTDLPNSPGLEQLRARKLIDEANLRFNQHRQAADIVEQARRITTEPELLIRLDLVEGSLAMDRRDHVKGQTIFHAALDRAVQNGNRYYEALALNNLAVASKRLNRYEESVDYATRALDAASKAGARRAAALAEGNLGSAYAYLGQFEAALAHEQQAVRINQEIGARSLAMTYLGELGLIYDLAGRTAEAVPCYERAYAAADELKLKSDAARFAENLALALIKSNDWAGAARWNDRAFAMAQESHADAMLPYLVRNRARIAWGLGNAAEATRLSTELLHTNTEQPAMIWEARALLGEIQTAAGHYSQANREFEAALHVIEQNRTAVLDPRNRVTLLSRLMYFYREYVDSLIVQKQDMRALAVAESSRARVLSERLGRELKFEGLADEATLRGIARQAGTSIVAFWVAPRRSFAWLITPDRVRRFDLPPAEEIESLVTAYRGVVEHSVADPMADPAGRALWEKVLGPATRDMAAGSHVIVVPDGPLHRLNLETVPVPGARSHYWLEDAEVSVAPSVSLAMAAAPAAPAARSLLLIGAPEYKGSGYQDLPGAAAEIEQLRQRFAAARPAVLTGKNATPAAYRAATPANYSLIHFAAHAEAMSERPLESAVVLSRAGDSFKLYASDVVDIPIHAELVTLSGCRSAGVRAYAGEGLMGFAWAFLHAGARAVVAGLWDVSDGVTAPLMAHFYDGVLANRAPATALREAKLRLIQEGRAKPFYWGAFQTYIGAGATPTRASAARP